MHWKRCAAYRHSAYKPYNPTLGLNLLWHSWGHEFHKFGNGLLTYYDFALILSVRWIFYRCTALPLYNPCSPILRPWTLIPNFGRDSLTQFSKVHSLCAIYKFPQVIFKYCIIFRCLGSNHKFQHFCSPTLKDAPHYHESWWRSLWKEVENVQKFMTPYEQTKCNKSLESFRWPKETLWISD